jgi:hypothetical protein
MITGAHDLTSRGALEVESSATAHWLRAVQSSPAAARDRPPRERVRTTWLGTRQVGELPTRWFVGESRIRRGISNQSLAALTN